MPKPPPLPKKVPTKPKTTHFTSTGPYAGSKPHPRSTTIPIKPGPAGETSQQRVARLREAARAARLQELNWQDRLVENGRTWADRAHRATTVSLIGFTVLATVVCGYSILDMVRHNRHMKKLWMADQQAKREEKLKIALEAYGHGEATEDQILLINQYKSVKESEDHRVQNRGVFGRTLDFLFPGVMVRQHEALVLEKLEDELYTSNEAKEAEGELVTSKDMTGSNTSTAASATIGGPLDKEANQLTKEASKSARSWISWISGR